MANIAIEQNIQAPAARVYHAFTNAAMLRWWLCDQITLNAAKGGHLFLWWRTGYFAFGEFTFTARHEQVAFRWRGQHDPDFAEVTVSFRETNGVTNVQLTHQMIGPADAWEPRILEITEGWQTGLENLKSVLETGVDLRITPPPNFELPETIAELTLKMADVYNSLDAQLMLALERVTEEEAAFKPASGEPGVKGIIAGVLIEEREMHAKLDEMIAETARWSDTPRQLVPARVSAVQTVYPGLADLLAALTRARQETLEFIAAIPVEFLERKPGCWRLGYELMGTLARAETYLAKIRSTVRAAREQADDLG